MIEIEHFIDVIDEKLKTGEKIIMAIDGKCGSGKTTLAKKLQDKYNCDVICMDDFFLPVHLRTKERLNEIGGNIHYERFKSEVSGKILFENTFEYNVFDCSVMDFNGKKTIQATPQKLIIVEGSYSLHPKYSDIYNLKVFIDITEEEQLKRILQRNSSELFEKFKKIWIPMENRYFEEYKIKEICDMIITT